MAEIITYNSIPDYDDFGFDTYWTCEQWRQWYDALEYKYGPEYARNYWSLAWEEQDTFEHNYNWCKYDGAFSNYMLTKGIDLGHIVSKVYTDAGEIITNLSKGAVSTSKLFKNIAPLIALGVGLYFVMPLIIKRLIK